MTKQATPDRAATCIISGCDNPPQGETKAGWCPICTEHIQEYLVPVCEMEQVMEEFETFEVAARYATPDHPFGIRGVIREALDRWNNEPGNHALTPRQIDRLARVLAEGVGRR